MPPIRQRQHSGPTPHTSSWSNGAGAKSVWFYMTGAKTPTRPRDDELQRYFDEDNQRRRSDLTYRRPRSSRIRCVVCLLEKDKWQTWHNRPGPIVKILRQHLDGCHAIVCTDDAGDWDAACQPSVKPTSAPVAKTKHETAPSSTRFANSDKSQLLVDAPRSGHSKAISQPTTSTSEFPVPSASEGSEEPKHGEPSQPFYLALMCVENLQAELDKVKAEYERVKAERDIEAIYRRALKQEVRRLKKAEHAKDQEILRLSNLLSSSL
ncbi:hypothetical protein RSOLAG22IIIB_08746 [Rhizoctonia solani]|uniref:Uncharacterized protein n=1 Tax=Rhizoctonia solani TaxID=456999 RepID=A0A0K6FV89_9AGAM|nr:hypothetical protein RSOLAG22IIIB_08746 [Rhizoctonia solani]